MDNVWFCSSYVVGCIQVYRKLLGSSKVPFVIIMWNQIGAWSGVLAKTNSSILGTIEDISDTGFNTGKNSSFSLSFFFLFSSVFLSVFLTLKQAVTSMTRSGTTSILRHITPPPLFLQSNYLSPKRSEIPINLGYSGKYPRMDHSDTTQACDGICIWHAQVHTWWYVHVLCGFVFACVCTKWVFFWTGGSQKVENWHRGRLHTAKPLIYSGHPQPTVILPEEENRKGHAWICGVLWETGSLRCQQAEVCYVTT